MLRGGRGDFYRAYFGRGRLRHASSEVSEGPQAHLRQIRHHSRISTKSNAASGRTGQMFAADYFGVAPDILLSAKGIASGNAARSDHRQRKCHDLATCKSRQHLWRKSRLLCGCPCDFRNYRRTAPADSFEWRVLLEGLRKLQKKTSSSSGMFAARAL